MGRKMRSTDRLSVPEYYRNKTIFVTGATGFMGKVLIEKLLRSCPGVSKIYVLLRSKKGVSVEKRLQMLFESPMFIRLKRNDPDCFKKIEALSGDVTELGLGLSNEDTQRLKNEVSLVFHVAACVRFDDTLKNAVYMNLRGTVEALKIASEMKKLESFLHMSTAYCIKYREEIKEKLYDPPADWRKILKIAEAMDEHSLETLSPKLMNFYPNTYTFTKALAEQAVADYADRFPVIIFRPSIVIASVTEPLPGWVDNFNGPVALIVASGKGIVRTIYSNPDIKSDFIPVDLAVKAMIVSVWNKVTGLNVEHLPVYNAAAGGIKPVSQSDMVEIGHYLSREVPLNDIMWLPGGYITQCKINFYIQFILFHFIPALVIDALLKYLDRKPILERIQRKIFLANLALEPFIIKQWNFENKKLIELDASILEEDREAFSYYKPDLEPIEFFRTACYGGRQYLMKEDNSNLDKARKHYWRMYWVDKIAKGFIVVLMVFLAVQLNFVSTIRNFILTTLDSVTSLVN